MRALNKMAFTGTTFMLLALGITNPDITEHEKKVTSMLMRLGEIGEGDTPFTQEASQATVNDPIAQKQLQIVTNTLHDVSSTFVEKGVQASIRVVDYLFCSIGEFDPSSLGVDRIQVDSTGTVYTIGILGHVFTLTKNDLLK